MGNVATGQTNDREIKKRVAKKTHISFETVSTVYEAIKKEIMDEVADGKGVKIKGMGQLEVGMSKPFKGRNVQTKELMIVESHRVVKFTPSLYFRSLVRYGRNEEIEEE